MRDLPLGEWERNSVGWAGFEAGRGSEGVGSAEGDTWGELVVCGVSVEAGRAEEGRTVEGRSMASCEIGGDSTGAVGVGTGEPGCGMGESGVVSISTISVGMREVTWSISVKSTSGR